jgi:hypothetical protein
MESGAKQLADIVKYVRIVAILIEGRVKPPMDWRFNTKGIGPCR